MPGGEHLKHAVCSFLPTLHAQSHGDLEQQCRVRSGLQEGGVWDRVTGTEGQRGQPGLCPLWSLLPTGIGAPPWAVGRALPSPLAQPC